MDVYSNTEIFKCMNTNIRIGGMNHSIDITKKIRSLFQAYERRFSRFLKQSEISTLNNQSTEIPIFISSTLYTILKKAVYFAENTDYLFNPFIGSRMEELGYDLSFQPDMQNEARELKSFNVTKDNIEFLPNMNAIIKHSEEKLDLGGIAKGWSVDQGRILATYEGIQEGFINAGGDLTVWGNNLHEVGISSPFKEGIDFLSLCVKDANIATSSPLYRKWKQGAIERHHILNGQTGVSTSTDIVQVTALAQSVHEAEVIAKTLCMVPFSDGINWLREHFQNGAAILIRNDGKVAVSNSIHLYVEGMNLL